MYKGLLCPVFGNQCDEHFESEDDLKHHLETTHPKSVACNGVDQLVADAVDAREWRRALF